MNFYPQFSNESWGFLNIIVDKKIKDINLALVVIVFQQQFIICSNVIGPSLKIFIDSDEQSTIVLP